MIVEGRVEGAIRCEQYMRSTTPWHIPNYYEHLTANSEIAMCSRCFHPLELSPLDSPEQGRMWRTSTYFIREWP
jgi:hypothetical protein